MVESARPAAAGWALDTAGAVPLAGLPAEQVENAAVAFAGNHVFVGVDGRVAGYDLSGRRTDVRSCGLQAITALVPTGGGALVAWDGDGLVSAILPRHGDCARPGSPAVLPPGSIAPVGAFTDGAVMVSVRDGQMFRVAPLPARDTVGLYRIARGGGSVTPVLSAPGAELLTWGGEGGAVRLPPPFPRDAFAAVSGERLWIADAESGELRGYDGSGRLGLIARAPIRGDRADPSETARWRARLERLSRGYLNEAERRSLGAGLTFPGSYAPFTALLVTDGGELWLRAGTAPGREGRWNIFSGEGAWLAEVRMPPGLDPAAVGERAVVARRMRDGRADQLLLVPLER